MHVNCFLRGNKKKASLKTTAIFRAALCAGVALSSACGVPKEEHAATLKQLEDTQIALSQSERSNDEQRQHLAELNQGAERSRQRIEELEAERARYEDELNAVKLELDEARGELKMYSDMKANLEEALKANKQELKELRQARAQAEGRLAQYRALTEKLASMVQSGKLSVQIRNGKMVIQLPDDVLFDPGRAELKQDGQSALAEVALILGDFDRSYLIAGHTDNVPISSKRFGSNWELSTARAVEVVTFLQDQGVSPKKLAAAGYGEFDPVASNETKASRALNRRIEIILMPNLNELPAIPQEVLQGGAS